jgi:hypothetical protein
MPPRRSNIETNAKRIFGWLARHRGEKFQFGEVCYELGLPTSKTTKAALRLVAALAEQSGLYLTVPCHENGWTLALTNDITEWPRPDRQLARIQAGIEARREQGFSFAQTHHEQLDASQQALLRGVLAQRQQIASQKALCDAMLDDLAETIS